MLTHVTTHKRKSKEDGLIDHFFCHHEYQGKGVGRHLMEHVLRVGKLQGITRFYSEVSITARPFYEKFGFKVANDRNSWSEAA